MNHPYRLSKSAIADLKNIINYTRQSFGENQLKKYISTLEECARSLAMNKGLVRRLPDIHPDIRYLYCSHHYIFGITSGKSPFQIIAIFHERMDLMSRLKSRL